MRFCISVKCNGTDSQGLDQDVLAQSFMNRSRTDPSLLLWKVQCPLRTEGTRLDLLQHHLGNTLGKGIMWSRISVFSLQKGLDFEDSLRTSIHCRVINPPILYAANNPSTSSNGRSGIHNVQCLRLGMLIWKIWTYTKHLNLALCGHETYSEDYFKCLPKRRYASVPLISLLSSLLKQWNA